MNIIDLDEYTREKFILALPDVADIIVLERTHSELRDWINAADIYRRWERKHLGKTDKWRILLHQELAVKQLNNMFFKHVAYKMSLMVQRAENWYRVILNRFNNAPMCHLAKFRPSLNTTLE